LLKHKCSGVFRVFGAMQTPERPSAKRAKLQARSWQGQIESKEIQDPIHGRIRLESLLVRIVDQPAFQRLRGIKQLANASLVYPGAEHSRFQHSLGVMHLAEKFLLAVSEAEHTFPRGVSKPDDKDVLCVKIAALCHDVGHGPFSHAFEGFVHALARQEEQDDDGGGELKKRLSAHTHERKSAEITNALVDEADKETLLLTALDRRFILELFLGKDLEGGVAARRGRGADKWWLYDLVSNCDSGLDVDKLDYLLRDPMNALGSGAGSGFVLDPLLTNARVRLADFPKGSGGGRPGLFDAFGAPARMERRPVICYNANYASEAYKVFRTRFDRHDNLYTHKVVQGFDLLLCEALLSASAVGRIRVGTRRMGLAEVVNSREAYQALTDESLLTRCELLLEEEREELSQEQEHPRRRAADGERRRRLERAERLFARYRSHQHFKCLGERPLEEGESLGVGEVEAEASHLRHTINTRLRELGGDAEPNAAPADPLLEGEVVVVARHIHFGKKASNPLDFMRWYKTSDLPLTDRPATDRLPPDAVHAHRYFERKQFRAFLTRVEHGGAADAALHAAAREVVSEWAEGRGSHRKRATEEPEEESFFSSQEVG